MRAYVAMSMTPYTGRAVFYKYFDTIDGRLSGPFSYSRTLQQVGDTATAEGPLLMCQNGWHAWVGVKSLRHQFSRASTRRMQWRTGSVRVFRVKLTEPMVEIGRLPSKVCARSVTLVKEISYGSAEGRRIRGEKPRVIAARTAKRPTRKPAPRKRAPKRAPARR